MAFADRSSSLHEGALEISRFSCMLFLGVRGFSDYAGPNSHSRESVAAVLPSSISERSRHPDPSAFRSSIARPTDASGLRFTGHLAMSPARLEARMESLFSFPVGLFHPLQHAGLSRRTPVCRRSTHDQRRRFAFALRSESYWWVLRCTLWLCRKDRVPSRPKWRTQRSHWLTVVPLFFILSSHSITIVCKAMR
jgi:hypothetical protein